MPLTAHEVSETLSERQHTDRAFTEWGALRISYADWHREQEDVYRVYSNEWDVLWPDHKMTRALPKVPNFVALASDARAQATAAVMPSLRCPPEKIGDEYKQRAEKVERILASYWDVNRLHIKKARWAHDVMSGGLMACKVLPDFTKPAKDRYPIYTRLDPSLSYPDPVFTTGPFVDSFVYAYEEKVRTIEKRYNVDLSSDIKKDPEAKADSARVIEFYDDEWIIVVVEPIRRGAYSVNVPQPIPILQERHGLSHCPVAIGVRPTMDGSYRGEFMGSIGILNFWNRLMTLSLDDAVNKTYPAKIAFDIENPEEWGPDALLEAQSREARFEFVQPPNTPFTNVQFMRDLGLFARDSTIFPPAASGDPNESIISAAGISGAKAPFVEDVAAIQRDMLAPMLEAANELALEGDEIWADVSKPLYGVTGSASYGESYRPSKDIRGCYRNRVVYGAIAGLDPINANVMAIQQLQNGIIDLDTAMEVSPFVEDPPRVKKRRALNAIDDAVFAGIIQQAAQGAIDAATLANIRYLMEEDEVTLHDAIAALIPSAPAPLAPPATSNPGANPAAPGIPGAAEGAAPNDQLPPLNQLMGAP